MADLKKREILRIEACTSVTKLRGYLRQYHSLEHWAAIARNRFTDAAMLEELAVRLPRQAAAHLNCSEALLHALSKNLQSEVRRQVARNPNTSSETLQALAQISPEPEVQFLVALHSNTNTETLDFLYRKDPQIAAMQGAIAIHPNCPIWIRVASSTGSL